MDLSSRGARRARRVALFYSEALKVAFDKQTLSKVISLIVPLSFASLLTGLVQSLGTTWGLFRHYWVLFKLLINILASILLLLHMQPISHIARVAAQTPLSSGDLRGLRIQGIADAGLALLVLIVATTLAVYKPPGMTPYGWRKLHEKRTVSYP